LQLLLLELLALLADGSAKDEIVCGMQHAAIPPHSISLDSSLLWIFVLLLALAKQGRLFSKALSTDGKAGALCLTEIDLKPSARCSIKVPLNHWINQ
jgi:hypothetical protein